MTPEEQAKFDKQQLELAKSVPKDSAGATELATRGFTPEQIGTNPLVASSTSYRKDVTDLGGDIAGDLAKYGIKQPEGDFDAFMKEYGKDIEAERKVAETRKKEDVAGIETDFKTAEETLKMAQEDALAKAEGRTRIGGFFTQMEAKDILNMQRQHRLELAALSSKKTETIQAAQRAYEDKNFELAKDLRKEAKDYEQDIYNRKKDFYNFVNDAAKDKRVNDRTIRNDAQDRIDTITKGIQDGTIDIAQIPPADRAQLMKDAGYGFDIFDKIAEQSKQGQVIGSPHIDNNSGAVYLLMKKKDGTYEYKKVGQTTPSTTVSEANAKRKIAQEKAGALAEARTLFTTPGGSGQGIAGTDGKIDPANYRATMQLFADKYRMTPSEFMKELPPEKFLSASELKNHPDLSSSKVGGGDPDTIEAYAQQWATSAITNPVAIPANIRDEVIKRAAEITAEIAAEGEK